MKAKFSIQSWTEKIKLQQKKYNQWNTNPHDAKVKRITLKTKTRKEKMKINKLLRYTDEKKWKKTEEKENKKKNKGKRMQKTPGRE